MSDWIRLIVGREEVGLLPHRAVHWPAARTLFVADTHIGKAATFRNGGIPVPDTYPDDLDRLSDALRETGAERLVVLGDLMHAPQGLTDAVIGSMAAWRAKHGSLAVELVSGNHDRFPDGLLTVLDVRTLGDEARDGPFLFRHDPDSSDPAADGSYVLSGHVHPAAHLNGSRWQSLRLPCFVIGRKRAILPAFGTFTGTARFTPFRGDRVFVVTGERVLEAAGSRRSPRRTKPD